MTPGISGVECDLIVAYTAPNAGRAVARHRGAVWNFSVLTNGKERCQLNRSAFSFLRPRPREETSIHQEIFNFLGEIKDLNFLSHNSSANGNSRVERS